jgi:hypothetical protein
MKGIMNIKVLYHYQVPRQRFGSEFLCVLDIFNCQSAIAKSQVNALSQKNCLAKSVIYQLISHGKTSGMRPTQTYVGLAENEFKTQFTNHKASFNKYEKRNSTELSKYIWNLKNNNISYSIRRKILKRAKSYIQARDVTCVSGRSILLFVNPTLQHLSSQRTCLHV